MCHNNILSWQTIKVNKYQVSRPQSQVFEEDSRKKRKSGRLKLIEQGKKERSIQLRTNPSLLSYL